jgi:hypothetical protein
MFVLFTKQVSKGHSSSRRMRRRACVNLETLGARDVPSSFTVSAMSALTLHYFPPQPIMPQVSAVSLSAVHHYPPNPI